MGDVVDEADWDSKISVVVLFLQGRDGIALDTEVVHFYVWLRCGETEGRTLVLAKLEIEHISSCGYGIKEELEGFFASGNDNQVIGICQDRYRETMVFHRTVLQG